MDRFRQIEAFASAARTATADSADLFNRGNKIGAHVVIDVTAIAATPSVVFKVQGKDPVSGKYYDILTSAAITGVGTTRLTVTPGVAASANVAISDAIPSVFRVRAEHADADSITYSVGVNLLG